jgi:helicase
MKLPDGLDYHYAEQQAVSLMRGLSNVETGWGELIAIAETIMSCYQEFPVNQTHFLYKHETALPLISAARIFDSASQPVTDIASEHKLKLGISSATAYAMHGNFPSAVAVAQRFIYQIDFDQFSHALIGTLLPSYIKSLIPVCENVDEKRYLELLEGFLESGDLVNADEIRELLAKTLLKSGADSENSLFRSARLCLEHILNLSVARVLNQTCPGLNKQFIFNIVSSGIPVLLPPQYKAIVDSDILANDSNLLIALPASTGKTLLGEMCLINSFQKQGGIGVYIAPYIALGNQVHRKIEQHLTEGFRIHKLIGGIHKEENLDPDNFNEVIVATPERFDMLLAESPWILERLRTVIFDEAHMLGHGTRGLRLEGMIARLRLQQLQGKNFRLVLLSALLESYESLKSWLAIPDKNLVVDSWRPTAQRTAIWEDNGQLTWYVGNDLVRRNGQENHSVVGEKLLPWSANDLYPTNEYSKKNALQSSVHANVAYLVEYLIKLYGGSVICVCSTKAGTRHMAAALGKIFEVLDPLPPTLSNAIGRIKTRHKFLLPLANLLSRGIAYHNSTLPPDIRALIEEAANKYEIKAIAATSTLSEGVDLPFRFTVIVDWLLWNSSRFTPMNSLLFNNVAGRCGRATEFTEGDTIIFDNPLGDLQYTDNNYRREIQHKTFLIQEDNELSSSLEAISPKSPNAKAYGSILSNQFLSAISENQNAENVMNNFGRCLLVSQNQTVYPRVIKLLENVQTYLLDSTELPFAKPASPISLTSFGIAANKTGLSPVSCRAVVRYLSQMSDAPDITGLANDLLIRFADLTEQPNENLKKILIAPGAQFCVKQQELPYVLHRWVSGMPRENIFAGLNTVLKMRKKQPLSDWLAGQEEGSPWDDEYDRFVDFIRGAIEGFLPWLMWACGRLSEFGNNAAMNVPWKMWAKMIEKGVDSMWAANALALNCPGRRAIVSEIGRLWPKEYQSETDPIGLTSIAQEDSRLILQSMFDSIYNQTEASDTISRNEIYLIQDWLWGRAGVYLPVQLT